MTIAAPTMKVTLHGHMTADQTWSMGVWMHVFTTTDALDMDAAATAFLTDALTWVGDVKGKWATETTFDGVKTAYYPPGASVATRVGAAGPSSPIAGLGSSNFLPTYCAVVHTLRTAISGRSFRGRVYFPVTSLALAPEGQLDNSTCVDLALRMSTLLTAWNTVSGSAYGATGSECVVASFTKGHTTKITRVDVDSKLDVQHRREDKVGAAHTAGHTVS